MYFSKAGIRSLIEHGQRIAASDKVDKDDVAELYRWVASLRQACNVVNVNLDIAYNMIAANMFSIVRLETAHIIDQVIHSAVEVKRARTGSGNLQLTLNVAASLAMLAGNVLSGGGMSLLGNLLVSAGGVVQGMASSDVSKVAVGLGQVAVIGNTMRRQPTSTGPTWNTAGSSGLLPGGGLDPQMDFEALTQTNVTSASVSGAVGTINTLAPEWLKPEDVQALKQKVDDDYVPKFSKTMWLEHGAGGAHAITCDVQEAAQVAYVTALGQLATELRAVMESGSVPKKGLLSEIIQSLSGSNLKGVHPMTARVMNDCVQNLSSHFGTTHYGSLTTGRSGFFSSTTLSEAQKGVHESYKLMATKDEFRWGKNAEGLVQTVKKSQNW